MINNGVPLKAALELPIHISETIVTSKFLRRMHYRYKKIVAIQDVAIVVY